MNSVKDHRVLSKGKEQIDILYEGTKNYWRTRTMIDIIIAHHIYHHSIEIIAYSPELDMEANRIYIDYENLIKNLNKSYVEDKLSEEIEILLRQKIKYCRKDVVTKVNNSIIANNIQCQLEIYNEKSDKDFYVSLKYDFGIDVVPLLAANMISGLNSDEEKSDRLRELVKLEEILIPKPILLDPLETVHFKQSSTSVIATFYEYLKHNEFLYKKVSADSNYAHYLERLAATTIDTIRRVFRDKVKLRIDTSQHVSSCHLNGCEDETNKYSTPRKRWIKAIDRVINKNFITRIKEKISESPFLTYLMKIKPGPKYHFQHYLDKTSPQKRFHKQDFNNVSDKDITRHSNDSNLFARKIKSTDDNSVLENTNFFVALLRRNPKKHNDNNILNEDKLSQGSSTSLLSPLPYSDKNKPRKGSNEDKSMSVSSSLPTITTQNGSSKSLNTSDKVKVNSSVRHLGDTKSSLLYKASAHVVNRRLKSAKTSDISILPKMSKKVSFSPESNTTSFIDNNNKTNHSNEETMILNSRRYENTSSMTVVDIEPVNEAFSCEVSSYHYGEQIKPADRFDKWEWYNTMKATLPDIVTITNHNSTADSKPLDSLEHNNYINGLKVNNRLMKLGSLKLQSMEDVNDTNNISTNNNNENLKSPSRKNRHTIDNSNIIISPKSPIKGFFSEDSDNKMNTTNNYNNNNNDIQLQSFSGEYPFMDSSDLYNNNIMTIINNNYDRPDTPMEKKQIRRVKNLSLQLTLENVSSLSPGKVIIDNMLINTISPKSQYVNNIFKL